MTTEALSLLELDGVAAGLAAVDVMVKQAKVEVIEANLVEPGTFVVLVGGGVAEVEESHRRALDAFGAAITSELFLPMVHPALMSGLRGVERREALETIGIVEGIDIASTLQGADRALKDARVELVGVRVAVGLGGRAYFLLTGPHHDVEAALGAARSVLESRGRLHRTECIARPHPEMIAWLLRPAPFQVG
ncbi:MAG: BMC domain-containing protein [Myxococcota bacterium]|nr:BMC domain-containing protein [Myxococcota bacterium]MEC9389407.1 BMC domain-containing protein [Myxococcota bacterium]